MGCKRAKWTILETTTRVSRVEEVRGGKDSFVNVTVTVYTKISSLENTLFATPHVIGYL